jgi:hypothetical protein
MSTPTVAPTSVLLDHNWWKPDIQEAVVFLAVIVILAFVIFLFHYNSVQKAVQSSRCYKLQDAMSSLGQYAVTARNARNDKLYTVKYDLDAKAYEVACACNPGSIANTYADIPVFDMVDQTDRKQTTNCLCDKVNLAPSDTTYYQGHPGITRFMKSGDTSFFEQAYDTSANKLYGATSQNFNFWRKA